MRTSNRKGKSSIEEGRNIPDLDSRRMNIANDIDEWKHHGESFVQKSTG